MSLDTCLLHYAYGLGSPPLMGTGVDPVFWICGWGHDEHCVKISVASLLPDPMATLLSSLTPRQNIESVVSAAAIGGVERHLLWLCFHLPGGWWPCGHEHSAFGSHFGRNVDAWPLLISVGSSALLWSGCKGYTLNTKSSSHVLINVFSHVLHSLLSTLYSQDFILSESWFHSLQLNKIPLCVCTTSVTHSSVTEQQGWLHISVFMNGTAIAMILQSLCGVLAGSPLSTHWEVLQWEQLVRQIAHIWHRMWI